MAATPTLVVVAVSRWCLWPVVDACTMAPSSMSCSMLWDSTMNRPALTGTTTSKSCCTMFSLEWSTTSGRLPPSTRALPTITTLSCSTTSTPSPRTTSPPCSPSLTPTCPLAMLRR